MRMIDWVRHALRTPFIWIAALFVYCVPALLMLSVKITALYGSRSVTRRSA
jgi:hypothetical protein